MKPISIGTILLIFSLALWIFVTGNLPGTVFALEGLPSKLNNKYPFITGRTSGLCSHAWAGMRKHSIQIPLSHNERLMRIISIHRQADKICKEVLLSVNQYNKLY